MEKHQGQRVLLLSGWHWWSRFGEPLVTIWSFKPLKREASAPLGTSEKGQGWHQETFQGSPRVSTCWHRLHTLTYTLVPVPVSNPGLVTLASITTITPSFLSGPSSIVASPLLSETKGRVSMALPASSTMETLLPFLFKWRMMLGREKLLKSMCKLRFQIIFVRI